MIQSPKIRTGERPVTGKIRGRDMKVELTQEVLWGIVEEAHARADEIKSKETKEPENPDFVALYYKLSASVRAIIIANQEMELKNQKKQLENELIFAQLRKS